MSWTDDIDFPEEFTLEVVEKALLRLHPDEPERAKEDARLIYAVLRVVLERTLRIALEAGVDAGAKALIEGFEGRKP